MSFIVDGNHYTDYDDNAIYLFYCFSDIEYINMMRVSQLQNCNMEKSYSPSIIRKKRALTVPMLSQINEECDGTEGSTKCSENISSKVNRNLQLNRLKQKNVIQKANLEYFPKGLEVVKRNLDTRDHSLFHIKLERISSGETLQTRQNRSFTK